MDVYLSRGGHAYLIPRFSGLRIIPAHLVEPSTLSWAAPGATKDVTDVGDPDIHLPIVALAEGRPAIIHEPIVFLSSPDQPIKSAQPLLNASALAPPAVYLLVGTDGDTLLLLAADHAEVVIDANSDTDQAQWLDLSYLIPHGHD